MGLQKFMTSRFGVRLGLALGRAFPPNLGYRLANFTAHRISRRKDSPMVQAVRQNQWVVRGEKSSPAELDAAVRAVFTHAGLCFVDLYKNLQNKAGILEMVANNEAAQKLIQYSLDKSRGAFVVAPHLSNFDLVLLALAYRGLEGQVLTYGNPTGGYQVQNNIRATTGLEITPVSPENHKRAVETLKNGGIVATAIDRPIRRKTHTLRFCGHPAPLPAGHIRMALRAEVPIIMIAAHYRPDGKYELLCSEPIELKRDDDRETEIRQNGNAVLEIIKTFIQQAPEQWLMFYPVWPEKMVNG
jgi:phosphatidylinositol dimannoside acyltransferase